MLDQCFRQANLKELSRDPVFFRGFLNKIREDSVKISGRAEENEAARAAEGCTERKKGHERSMRVLSLCVSDSSSHLEQLRTEPYSVFIAQNARKERF